MHELSFLPRNGDISATHIGNHTSVNLVLERFLQQRYFAMSGQLSKRFPNKKIVERLESF